MGKSREMSGMEVFTCEIFCFKYDYCFFCTGSRRGNNGNADADLPSMVSSVIAERDNNGNADDADLADRRGFCRARCPL